MSNNHPSRRSNQVLFFSPIVFYPRYIWHISQIFSKSKLFSVPMDLTYAELTVLVLNMLQLKFEQYSSTRCSFKMKVKRVSIKNNQLCMNVQWNLVITRSDITKSSYNEVILLVPALSISLFFYPDIMRNLI